MTAEWALRFAADAEAGGHTPDEPFWDDLVHRELPNLRAVRRQLVDQDRLPELVALLRGLYYWAGYRGRVRGVALAARPGRAGRERPGRGPRPVCTGG